MWFKRRKKTEQDHALSQSLRSLQTLLNETDRREPSLEARQPDTDSEAPAGIDDAAPPPAINGGNGDTILKEPAPPDSASRWRDLNLSFDAEPVMPYRSRHGADIDAQDRAGDDAGEPELDSADPVDALDTPPADGQSTDTGPIDIDERPDPFPADAGAISPDEPPAIEPADIDDIVREEPVLPAADLVAGQPDEQAAGDRPTENQLRLQLESEDDTGDDIPTLTEAVYVPDTPLNEPELEEPELEEPAPDGNIERCVERLRARLQVMKLDILSPEQEAQLRETLVELLDELDQKET